MYIARGEKSEGERKKKGRGRKERGGKQKRKKEKVGWEGRKRKKGRQEEVVGRKDRKEGGRQTLCRVYMLHASQRLSHLILQKYCYHLWFSAGTLAREVMMI